MYYDIQYAYVNGYFDWDIIEETWNNIRLDLATYMEAHYHNFKYT